jgi:hypothetical protein
MRSGWLRCGGRVPPPPGVSVKYLLSMRYRIAVLQTLQSKGVTGKVFQTKDLEGVDERLR